MPFLISIILQRILIFVYSILIFLGVAPEISIPTDIEAAQVIEERQQTIVDVIVDNSDSEDVRDTLSDIGNSTDGGLEDLQSAIPTPDLPSITEAAETVGDVIQDNPLSIEISPSNSFGDTIENVVVNTVCVRHENNTISVSTGSGVIISPEGVVITNSHVGQFFLLQDNDPNYIDCALYKENIPTFGYEAEVLYISPEWIEENYDLISDSSPRGTGENDYALLYITESTNPTLPVPSSFPSATPLITTVPEVDQKIIAAGYPGSPTSILDLTKSVQLVIDSLTIKDVFTFNDDSIDIFSTSKSDVGAKGSSGGGIFYNENSDEIDLLGIIVTTDGQDGHAQINALTLSYINRAIYASSNHNLGYYLSSNLSSKADGFKNKYGDELTALLLSEL